MIKYDEAQMPSPERQADRRRFARVEESVVVEITFADPLPTTIDALLIESSEEGFRIVHNCKELVPGLQIFMRRKPEVDQRLARVVWSHVRDRERVSGCFLL